jgi:hypothetical protein
MYSYILTVLNDEYIDQIRLLRPEQKIKKSQNGAGENKLVFEGGNPSSVIYSIRRIPTVEPSNGGILKNSSLHDCTLHTKNY